MMNFFKIIFYLILFMSTMISISSYTWLGTWMGLEINLLSFIPLLNNKNNPLSSETSIKYFLVQALASSLFLFMIIMLLLNNNILTEIFNKNMFLIMINSSLFMKMGAAPFHFWFPEIAETMNWLNLMILMTWQKIAPMMIVSYTIKYNNFIVFIIIMSTLIGSLKGLNQTSIRKIMTYSSINHMGWMISSFLYSNMLWFIYFIMYSFMSIMLMIMFNYFKIFYLKQMFNFMNKNMMIKINLNMNFLSLGGLPPFLGFMPKWLVIQSLSYKYMYMILFMILMALITLFFYLRIAYSSLMLNNNTLNINIIKYNNINIMMLIMTFISMNGLFFCTYIFNMN